MFSRMIAIFVSSFLPTLGVILPMSGAYRANALIAGTLATALVAFSLVDQRARLWAAVIGAWVSFMPFIVPSTLTEKTLNVMWGVAMFTFLIGPFSEEHASVWVRATATKRDEPEHQPDFRAAA
jgi:hypothetical protein